MNWFPMGLTYAFLYMGRYNLTVAKNELGELMTKEDFGIIFAAGTATYAIAFLINGPLTDKFGGKKAILIAALGSGLMNLLMGFACRSLMLADDPGEYNVRYIFSGLYAANMYFQSFGAVAIVKVNSNWFHVRERGGFSGIFGTMISSGIWLAFTVNGQIVDMTRTDTGSSPWWVFFAPTIALWTMFVFEFIVLRDHPGQAGQEDIETGAASHGDDEGEIGALELIWRIVSNPIILTVAFIEFCTGVLRNGVMHWFPIYAKEVWALPSSHWLRRGDWGDLYTILPFFVACVALGLVGYWRTKSGKKAGWLYAIAGLLFLVPFLQGGWGGLLMVAGVMGGNIAGWVSDLVFNSRRAPAAGMLYGLLCISAIGMYFALGGSTNTIDWVKEGKTQLKVDDTVLVVAGQDVEDWTDIASAVACVPSTCEAGHWDREKCTCSTALKKAPADLVVSTGVIPVTIMRGGEKMELALKDPKQQARPGDRRKLAAGPKLPLNPVWLGIIVFIMSLCVIGTHGLLSGTATMDFGGKKGAATAVGVIDGFVYAGTAVQSVSLGYLTSTNWEWWPIFLFPFGILGLFLLTRIWYAMPGMQQKKEA